MWLCGILGARFQKEIGSVPVKDFYTPYSSIFFKENAGYKAFYKVYIWFSPAFFGDILYTYIYIVTKILNSP